MKLKQKIVDVLIEHQSSPVDIAADAILVLVVDECVKAIDDTMTIVNLIHGIGE